MLHLMVWISRKQARQKIEEKKKNTLNVSVWKKIKWVCKAYAFFGGMTHVYWWLGRLHCCTSCQCAAVVEKEARDVWKIKTRELGIAFKLTCVGEIDEDGLVETVRYLLGLMEQGHIQLWRVQKHDIRWLLRSFEIDRLFAFIIYLNLIRSASWILNCQQWLHLHLDLLILHQAPPLDQIKSIVCKCMNTC